MTTLPTIEENPNGLHQRYVVSKASGEPVDPQAIYFVLRLDNGGDDNSHLEACREAARAYCRYVFKFPREHPLRPMIDELWQLVNDIEAEND